MSNEKLREPIEDAIARCHEKAESLARELGATACVLTRLLAEQCGGQACSGSAAPCECAALAKMDRDAWDGWFENVLESGKPSENQAGAELVAMWGWGDDIIRAIRSYLEDNCT